MLLSCVGANLLVHDKARSNDGTVDTFIVPQGVVVNALTDKERFQLTSRVGVINLQFPAFLVYVLVDR